MNNPALVDMPTHFRGDGLKPFRISLEYSSGNPVDLTGCSVRMVIMDFETGEEKWTFSTEGVGEKKLTFGEPGEVWFPEISKWEIPSSVYAYRLDVTTSTGFLRTFLKGKWPIHY